MEPASVHPSSDDLPRKVSGTRNACSEIRRGWCKLPILQDPLHPYRFHFYQQTLKNHNF